jgi:glycerate kinase
MNLNKIFIKHYDVDLSNLKGTGAAGGLGGGALVFLKAKM